MSRVKKVSWITTGTFSQRLAKESLVIFPCALIFACYYVFVRSDVAEFSVLKLLAVAIGITLSFGIYNARKPAPQPVTDPSQSDALQSLRRDEIG